MFRSTVQRERKQHIELISEVAVIDLAENTHGAVFLSLACYCSTLPRVTVTAVLLQHVAVLLSLPTLLSRLQPVKSQIVALVFCLCIPMNTLRGQSWK